MKLLLYGLIAIVLLYLLYLISFSALHGEVHFSNDIARNFLLLKELDEKKIVFIGPRSSTQGLFYSSFLTYLNYPSYILGGGNPVVVAWFWVMLGVGMIVASFFMAKKLFGIMPALVYILIIAARLVPKSAEIFEPMAIYFVMPVFLFTIFQYSKTKKPSYLVWHMIILSIFIHLSIGIGIQFLFLSSIIILYLILKTKHCKHLLSFFILPASLINLILFDIKHNFGMLKALLSTGGASTFFVTINDWLSDRFNHMVSLELLDDKTFLWLPIFICVITFTILLIKNDKKKRHIYILFLVYYFGYLAFSYFNKGLLLTHYVYLLIPFTSLWLVSFLNSKYKTFFVPVILFVFLFNLQFAIQFTKSLETSFIGKHPYSWVGLLNVAEKVAKEYKGREFGYYVFAPDAYAYQPRYAMIYGFKKERARAYEYKKLPTTLVIAQPPPADDPLMNYSWWVKNPLHIVKAPEKVDDFPNGYKIARYKLTAEEQQIPHDKNIELGIHFR